MKFAHEIAGLENVNNFINPVEKEETELEGMESLIDSNLQSAIIADNEAIFNGEVSRFGVESVHLYAGLEADNAATKESLFKRLYNGIISIFKALGRYVGTVIDYIKKKFKKDKVIKEAEKSVEQQADLVEACSIIRKKNKKASESELMQMFKDKATEMGLTGFGTGAEADDSSKKVSVTIKPRWNVNRLLNMFSKDSTKVMIEAYLPYYDSSVNILNGIKKANNYINTAKGTLTSIPDSVEEINQSIINVLILMANTIGICLRTGDIDKKFPDVKEAPTKVTFVDNAVNEANKGLGDILILMNATGPITLTKIELNTPSDMSASEVKSRFKNTEVYKTAVEMYNNVGTAIEAVSTYHNKFLSGTGIGTIERVLKTLDFKAGRGGDKSQIEGLKETLPKFQRIVKLFMKVITTQRLKETGVEIDL